MFKNDIRKRGNYFWVQTEILKSVILRKRPLGELSGVLCTYAIASHLRTAPESCPTYLPPPAMSLVPISAIPVLVAYRPRRRRGYFRPILELSRPHPGLAFRTGTGLLLSDWGSPYRRWTGLAVVRSSTGLVLLGWGPESATLAFTDMV